MSDKRRSFASIYVEEIDRNGRLLTMKRPFIAARTASLTLLLTGTLVLAQQPAPPAPQPAPTIPANAPHAADIQAARQVAEAWIQLLDVGEFDQAYQELGFTARRQITQEQWRQEMKNTREKHGPLESRIFQYPNYTTTLKNAPTGQYVVLNYLCTFTSHKTAPEIIVMAKNTSPTDTNWHVAGFSVE